MESLQYRPYEKEWFVLTEDFHFPLTLKEIYQTDPALERISKITGLGVNETFWIVAPKGFITDLASVPEAAQRLMGWKSDGPWKEAACLHDLLYQKVPSTLPYPATPLGLLSSVCDKRFADYVFLRVMQAYGVPRAEALSFYEAVHQFGWEAYHDDNTTAVYRKDEEVTRVENYLFFRKENGLAVPERYRTNHNALVDVRYINLKRAVRNV